MAAKTAEYDASKITVLEGLRTRPPAAGHVYRVDRARAACIIWSMKWSTTPSTKCWPAMPKMSTSPFMRTTPSPSWTTGAAFRWIRSMISKIRNSRENPALEIVMTVLHAGGKFDKDTYKVSGGLHGVGVSVTNALSEWLEVEVYRNGKIYSQKLRARQTPGAVKQKGPPKIAARKSPLRLIPRFSATSQFSFDTLSNRLRELAFLNPGTTHHDHR